MKFGFAKEIITPKSKIALACFVTSKNPEQPYLTIHDDVFVRTCYIENGSKLLMIVFDLLFHNDELNNKIMDYSAEKYGIPRATVLVNYTHSHTAPAARGYCDILASEEYEDFLFERASACIDRALTNLIEGEVGYESVPCDWSISRRRITNGMCGGIEPSDDNVREKRMDILKFVDLTGKIRGIVTFYASHPVHFPGEGAISGEYPSRLCALLECEYYGAYALFFQGAGATSHPRTVVSGTRFVKREYEDVDIFAAALFKVVKTAIDQNKFQPLKLLISGSTDQIRLGLEVKPKEYFEAASKTDMGIINNYGVKRILENYETMPDFILVNAGMIRLADRLFICHMGGEPGYEIKELLMRALPDIRIIFVGYTDSCSYVPTDQMLAEGGYEVHCYIEYAKPGILKPGIDAKVIHSFREMYDKLLIE